MAASVLLSAESAVPLFTVGHPAGAAHHGLPSAPGAASWSRSLDRALDEAAATGALTLSGRKLKEFPRSAAGHDLTDTTRAGNQLTELPVEVCMFVSLESLNLYQNCLRSLPERLINLQSLTYLNISRNQLSTLPAHLCRLPLKVLIACNNKLVSLPEDLGKLRQLTELDVSCNEIQTLPPQIGQLETLRDLNIRRNHLVRLPPELAELPLVRLDFSCNKVTTIPVCYRNLRHLQSIILDNNPLQSPPAQICIKGKIHIFKYLNMEAFKAASDLPDYDRRPLPFGSWIGQYLKIWNLRVQKNLNIEKIIFKVVQMKFLAMHITNQKLSFDIFTRSKISVFTNNWCLFSGGSDTAVTSSYAHNQRSGGGVERVRREAQLAALRYEEERQKTRSVQRDAVMNYVKHKSSQSPTKPSPTDSESLYPSRRSTHTDDSALFMSEFEPLLIFEIDTDTNTIKKRPDPHKQMKDTQTCLLSLSAVPLDGRVSPTLSVAFSCTPQVLNRKSLQSPSPSRGPSQRPESYLFCLSQREKKKEESGTQKAEPVEATPTQSPAPTGEEAMLIEQLRRNIECRLKVSLPSDLGAALTDGVVLCHLANHVRPRSIPSIHVPSPAVPKLTMAKCRRNVENFLEACRRIGVPQNQLCLPLHILEERGLPQVAGTVRALLDLAPPKHTPSPSTTPTGPSAASPLAL
uniref:Leucine-rich repeat and calponin homology domain-containing protein 3-like n=1 Tax=Sinocyclocheilus grahami TaxID=75366 RepID=A0A672RVX3_SINGR